MLVFILVPEEVVQLILIRHYLIKIIQVCWTRIKSRPKIDISMKFLFQTALLLVSTGPSTAYPEIRVYSADDLTHSVTGDKRPADAKIKAANEVPIS